MLSDSMAAMERYCSATGCRRAILLGHFGEGAAGGNCGMCDNCIKGPAARSRDLGAEARLLLAAVQQTGGRFGSVMPISVLRGSEKKARGRPASLWPACIPSASSACPDEPLGEPPTGTRDAPSHALSS